MDLIKQALRVMESEFKGGEYTLNSAEKAKDFCRLQIGASKDEVFAVLFLDNKLRNLDFKIFAYGTINSCDIHLRPIVRHALEVNAANIILTHNHPSGDCTPSRADIALTAKMKAFFKEINIEVVDHIIVSAIDTLSLTETGDI